MSSANLLLLDTHIWIEWAQQGSHLPKSIADAITNHEGSVAVSAASIYETVILVRRKRILLNRDVDDWIERATVAAGVAVLAVDAEIARQAGHFPPIHGDPIDRLIIASAVVHDALLVSFDSKFPGYVALSDRLLNGKESSP